MRSPSAESQRSTASGQSAHSYEVPLEQSKSVRSTGSGGSYLMPEAATAAPDHGADAAISEGNEAADATSNFPRNESYGLAVPVPDDAYSTALPGRSASERNASYGSAVLARGGTRPEAAWAGSAYLDIVEDDGSASLAKRKASRRTAEDVATFEPLVLNDGV